MKNRILVFATASFLVLGCAEMTNVLEEVNKQTTGEAPLTNGEVIGGLKEALTVGANKSTDLTSKMDGFYKNPEIFIPFPPEAIKVKEKVIALGMENQVNDFVLTLNRAAETAS